VEGVLAQAASNAASEMNAMTFMLSPRCCVRQPL
jgi:hypothetical protein